MTLHFTKVHGLGNDFMIVDTVRAAVDVAAVERAAVRLCDRNFGVGADGVLLLEPSEVADYRMRLLNRDGSEAEMCGNGIRAFGKFIYDSGLKRADRLRIETLAGIQVLQLNARNGTVDSVRVDMGEPQLTPAEIPTTLVGVGAPLTVGGESFNATCVSMGNPHCVIFVDQWDDFPFKLIGPKLEHHPAFPRRTNVHFVKVVSRTEVRVKVWERGAGPTLACGTGACAVLVAGVLNGVTERAATVHLPGGPLQIEWAADNHVFMTGPATIVYDGEIEI